MAFRKIFLFVNPDLAAPVPSDSPSTQIGLISKLPVYYFGETVIFCISLVDSQGNAVPYLTSDTFEMSVDNNFRHNDDLMAHTEGKADGTDSKVNVPGDWAAVSAANGKFSVRVDFNTVSYETKIGGSEFIQVRTELKKFDAGSEDPAILMQSISTARNVVNGGEGEPEEADPNYLTAAQTRALAAAEAGNKWKTGSGSPTYSSETEGDLYLDTSNSNVYQVVSGGYALVGNIEGQMPALSAGSAVPVSAGAPPAVDVVPISGGYRLDLEIPAGEKGEPGPNGSLTVPIQPYSSDSAYSALTCISYNGGGYQVTSDTTAGENPDNTPAKFICFASRGEDGEDGRDGYNGSDGEDGITPVLSGGSVTTLPAGSPATAEIVPSGGSMYVMNLGIPAGQPGPTLIGASQIVSSLTSGNIEVDHAAVPVALKTSTDKFYYLEKGTITISSGAWIIDPAAYLAYAGESAFVGPWTVYFAGGIPDNMPILSGGSAIVPQEHRAFQVALTSDMVISVNSSGLTSSVCVTQELWLDMPSTPVSFTLPGFTWVDGAAPDFSTGDTRYVLTVRWNGAKFLANLAYTEDLT